MNPNDPIKIAIGVFLLLTGTLLAIKAYPTPVPLVLSSVPAGISFRPGQELPQAGLPWEVFLGYFRLLMSSMVMVNLGALMLYSGLTRAGGAKTA